MFYKDKKIILIHQIFSKIFLWERLGLEPTKIIWDQSRYNVTPFAALELPHVCEYKDKVRIWFCQIFSEKKLI